MRQVLEHFRVEGFYGWNQDWFPDFFMRMGGCAAVTACDSCVYFALRKGRRELIPFDPAHITREDYLKLSRMMKRTLGPRMRGVDRLELYQEGFAGYLQAAGVSEPKAEALHGSRPFGEAAESLQRQIETGCPVPFLLLRHTSGEFREYEWHWFLLMGYDCRPDQFLAQAVTYGTARWLDFGKLWETGLDERGGMILFSFP